jgi:hypothetical protein
MQMLSKSKEHCSRKIREKRQKGEMKGLLQVKKQGVPRSLKAA